MDKNKSKSIYTDSPTFVQALLILCSIAMLALSIYLTKHYFDTLFPGEVLKSAVCNINSFFNCDTTALSPVSQLFGIPFLSLLGILMGAFLLLGFMFPGPKGEGTSFFLLKVNLVGCIGLLIYSLTILKALCPFCALYYLASAGALALFWRYGHNRKGDLKTLGIFAAITLASMGATKAIVFDKEKKKSLLAQSLVDQLKNLPRLAAPSQESPYLLARASGEFAKGKAPLHISIFSDFQCPACKALNDIVDELLLRYRGKADVQYFFYPLDHRCNKSIKRPLHPLACKAAYLASCASGNSGEFKFKEVHDHIFRHQRELTGKWLDDYAEKLKLTSCMRDPKTQQRVEEIIAQAAPFNVKSTPTLLINGIKVEGVLPFSQLTILFDELIQ